MFLQTHFIKKFILSIMKKFLQIFVCATFALSLALVSAPAFGNEVAAFIGVGTFAVSFIPTPSTVLGMNSIAARMVFDNAKSAVMKAFPGDANILGHAKLTQGSLRFSQPMAAGITQYQFPILVNETQLGIFNNEIRLNLQDAFVVSELGIFISVPGSNVDTTYKLNTYPNQVLFGANAANMNSLYNGFLSLTINNDVVIPKWDIYRHLFQAQTQQTAALGAGSPNDQQSGKEDSFYPVEPNVVLIGSKNNVLQINMPAGFAAVQANSRIEILVRGVLAQNVTVVS
jgi:hypothetical protein